MSSIAVLGAGGVGGFVAAALARAGADVTVIARPETAAVLAADGLSVRSRVLGDFNARPAVAEWLSGDVDTLIVATKATGLDEGLDRVEGRPALVVPLLNGIEHLRLLRARFGDGAVAAAVIRIESDRPQTGTIIQTSPSCRIDIAGPEPGVATALSAAGIDVRCGGREPDVMWSKLARLCPLALTTSAADQPIGFVRTDPEWRPRLIAAIQETIAVANADGAELAAADTLAELDGAHPELGSSMQRDIAAGRATELDAIAGAVLRAGALVGLRCETVGDLAARVAERSATAAA